MIKLVRRPYNTACEERYIVTVRKSGRCSVLVFGILHAGGLRPIVKIDGRFNAQQYEGVLNGIVLPFIERQFPDDNYYYYQDYSPVHTGTVINQWFARNLTYYQLMHTPTKSPDLNPIEHDRAHMKVNMAHNGPYANEDEFGDLAILDAWNRLRENPNFPTNLVNSMQEEYKL